MTTVKEAELAILVTGAAGREAAGRGALGSEFSL